MLFSELKCKEVINIGDCKRLGKVSDLEFDHCTGCIKKIMIPACGGLFWPFRGEQNYVICYNEIKQIGPDIILVDINCS